MLELFIAVLLSFGIQLSGNVVITDSSKDATGHISIKGQDLKNGATYSVYSGEDGGWSIVK